MPLVRLDAVPRLIGRTRFPMFVVGIPAALHPDLVPFDQLPEHEKQKDRLFMAIVRSLAPETRPV